MNNITNYFNDILDISLDTIENLKTIIINTHGFYKDQCDRFYKKTNIDTQNKDSNQISDVLNKPLDQCDSLLKENSASILMFYKKLVKYTVKNKLMFWNKNKSGFHEITD